MTFDNCRHSRISHEPGRLMVQCALSIGCQCMLIEFENTWLPALTLKSSTVPETAACREASITSPFLFFVDVPQADNIKSAASDTNNFVFILKPLQRLTKKQLPPS
ncbi:hypothetical protein FGO68_gene6848 [Halteria grandinella]|uniref:Uncharacterized protein n=1 Tax=Halteria grandinella TaxID=5974 RepID=A0A8J8SUV0_HALGN|nr:hypothetical protein FGO68_gene6848 [Halteria grandinella]